MVTVFFFGKTNLYEVYNYIKLYTASPKGKYKLTSIVNMI
jgi:hypothetical protein